MYFRMLFLFVSAVLLSTTTAPSRKLDVVVDNIDVVQGKYMYHPPAHGWLKQHKVITTWQQALQRCQSEGAVLASPLTEDLKFAMRSLMNDTTYFIGANARFHGDIFMSVEGVPLEEMPVGDMFAYLDPQDGQCLSMDREAIRVASCTSRMAYFCFKNDQNNTRMTECGTLDKAYKLEPSTGSCYKYVYYDRKSWTQAYAICDADGGYLAIVNNRHEADVLKAGITDTSYYMLIGLRDWLGGGSWMSIHGDPLHELHNVWENGKRPNNSCCDCGMMHPKTAMLKELPCDVASHYICEKDPKSIQFSTEELLPYSIN